MLKEKTWRHNEIVFNSITGVLPSLDILHIWHLKYVALNVVIGWYWKPLRLDDIQQKREPVCVIEHLWDEPITARTAK